MGIVVAAVVWNIVATLLIGSCYAQTLLVLNNITTTKTGITANTQARLYYELPAPLTYPSLSFISYPCFGHADMYVGYGFVPNSQYQNNTCNLPFIGYDKQDYACTINLPRNNTMYNILVVGTGQFSGSPDYSAIFDFLVTNAAADVLVPVPGNTGTVTATPLSNVKRGDPQQLTLAWQGTGNVNDKYSIYQYAGSIPANSGYITATGCGVKFFMTPRTDVAIQKNGEAYQAVVNNLDSVNPTAVAVVVDRSGGYTASYRVVLFNGGEVLGASLIALALLFFTLF